MYSENLIIHFKTNKQMKTTNTTTASYSNFTELYNSNYSIIFNYIHKKMNYTNKVDAVKELTNDVFIKANNHLINFDANKSSLKTWLCTIANNTIIDYYRANKNENNSVNIDNFVDAEGNEFLVIADTTETDSEVNSNELMNGINNAFNSLKDNYKTIANLFFIEQKSHKEICEICNLPLNTVKVMILRCREKLQNTLQSERKIYC